MTIVYYINRIQHSLTVPPESVRGLQYKSTGWIIYVSDPANMAVSQFKIQDKVVKLAAESFETDKLLPTSGNEFMDWLLKQNYIDGDYYDSNGKPGQFPPPNITGPRPSLDRGCPNITR